MLLNDEYTSEFVVSCLYFCSYTPVYKCVWTFLDKADGQEDKAAAVMRLGAAKHFMAHTQPVGYTHLGPFSIPPFVLALSPNPR